MLRPTYLLLFLALAFVGGCGGGGGAAAPAGPNQTLVEVWPLEASTAGGALITLHGSGFSAEGFEGVRLFFGETAAPGVLVVDDATITCTCPPGRLGPVTIYVYVPGQAGAVLAGGFRYVAAVLYVADGPGALAPALHRVDLDALTVTSVGQIGYPVGALTAWGEEAFLAAEPVSPFRLIRISKASGVGVPVALLRDATTGANVHLTDLTRDDGRLLGRTIGGTLAEVDPQTGLTQVIDLLPGPPTGPALAARAPGQQLFGPEATALRFQAWDPINGLVSVGVDVSALGSGELIASMAQEGRLFGLRVESGIGATRDLLRIDLQTGAVVPLLTLPFSIAALAGDPR